MLTHFLCSVQLLHLRKYSGTLLPCYRTHIKGLSDPVSFVLVLEIF